MDKLKTNWLKIWHNFIAQYAVLAILVNLFIETFARLSTSPAAGLEFMIRHPLIFLFNSLIIFTCMSLSLLFKNRRFFLILFGGIWVVLGIVNGIIQANRMTPFTTNDIMELKDGLSIATTYLSKMQIILLVAGIAAIVALLVLIFFKSKKAAAKVVYKKAVPRVLLIIAIAIFATFGCVKTGILDTYFPNLNYGYRDNGFSYCFLATGFDKGVRRPANYSEANVKKIFTTKEMETTVAGKETSTSVTKPNIIFLQLESFIDPSFVKDIKLSQDPIPYYRYLMKTCSTGKLRVPAVGAGTANTEFESMTGMSVHFFGPGEYPYNSILLKENCESIPYDLKQLGYSTHAIHDHRAAFYHRNEVFGNLGYQTFTSVEYMNNVSRTPKGWARDYVLTSNIMDALKSTKGSDYIYTISVQGHGKYPTEKVINDPTITCTSAPTDELKWSWEYYANQIYEMDQFVKQLTTTLKKYDEPTILVMYGDHLPALDNLTEDNLKGNRSVYQTNYVIWSNYKYGSRKVEDLTAYQIGSELLNRIGIHNGTMVTFQQDHRSDKNYRAEMKMLQYDMLYGEKYIYGGTNPFKPISLKMGVKEIKIKKIVKIGEKYYIKGQNFTEYSKITVGDKVLKTTYLGPTILGLNEDVDPSDISKMKVSQTDTKNDTILSTTE
ncbi:MAG: LTA synthase family protein [Eubacteriaceae bacterium]|jgi:phosphoglycerol transferase MdoB-like AlkP superfamily enzyme|nr:LTA synthase family protein [Eubacteriaceae bacterium]